MGMFSYPFDFAAICCRQRSTICGILCYVVYYLHNARGSREQCKRKRSDVGKEFDDGRVTLSGD